jgi:3-hydroxy-9,10-secoandrosta-1,3,5(10)-triene-9,17-dione monooxygenase reductase component
VSQIGDDPFSVPRELRDPVRRLRGQLAAPVTLWTTHGAHGRAGLTVSSLLVAEGPVGSVLALIGPLTDFWEVLAESRRCVVHVLGPADRRLAEVFAGHYPEPEPFGGVAVSSSAWGPVVELAGARAFCELGEVSEVGYSLLVRAEIVRADLGRVTEPLVYHRGAYARLEKGWP